MKQTGVFKLIGIFLIFCCCPKVYSQYSGAPPNLPIVNQYGASLRQIIDSMYASAPSNDTMEGGDLDEIKMFSKQWEGRVYANDSTGTNMFQKYFQTMKTEAAAKVTSGGCGDGKWECIGAEVPGKQLSGYVCAIWASPSDSSYLLAGTLGGLFKSTNAGATWDCITDNTILAGPSLAINSIAVSPLNTNIMLIGTRGGGILKSTNGGTTWSYENVAADGEVINHIFFTPDGLRLYALRGNSVFTRLYSASSWTDITPSGVSTLWDNIQFDPGNRSHFFLSSMGDNTGIWETYDSLGSSYTKITSGFTSTIGVTFVPATNWSAMNISMPKSDTLYFIAMEMSNNKAALFKYNITGVTHTIEKIYDSLPSDRNPNIFHFSLIVSPSNINNIYYASDKPFQAYDRTNGFTAIGRYEADPTHGDIRCMWLQAYTSAGKGIGDRLYLATDGGVSQKPSGIDITVSGDYSTKDISGHGLNCGTYWGYSTYEADQGIGTMMHDGIVSFQPDITPQWHSIDVVDAWGCDVDKSDPEHAYVSQGFGWVGFERTWSGGGRKMNTDSVFVQPADASFDGLGVGAPYTTDKFGNIYFLKNSFWRKKPSDVDYKDLNVLYGTPNSGLNYGACIALNPNDTSFDGYVLYNTSDAHVQHIYYRRKPSVITATEVSHVPGSSSYHINNIVTDPNNTERVWVCLGEVNNNTYTHTRYRVFYSTNHGGSWIDVSNGLPQKMPVAALAFDEATNMLYASTDIGVYRCNFNNYNASSNYTNSDGILENDGVSWACFNKGLLPGKDFPNISGSLHINHCQRKLYIATFGRSVWSTDLYDGSDGSTTPLQISSNTTWSSNKTIMGNVKIQPGATLTIAGCTIFMPKNGIIEVAAGAKLVVDHSVITNNCAGCMWEGIVGDGHYGMTQTVANQATIIIQNNSVIENANNAVSTYDPDPVYVAGTKGSGAIIQASQSTFLNNRNSVTFLPYHNVVSPTYAPNVSYFDRCTFIIDTNCRMKLTNPMRNHVSLTSVEGIKFMGCKFINRNWSWHISGSWGYGEGIHSYDASFRVMPYCTVATSCTSPVRSYFSGLGHGIMIKGGFGVDQPVNIDKADFDSTGIGVHVSAQNNVVVTQCNFTVGRGNNLDSVIEGFYECGNIGILIQNASQFYQEANYFRGKKNYAPFAWTPWNNIGTLIANTGGYANKVYRSTFDSLTKGVLSVGNNRYNVPARSPYTAGVKVLCNTFSRNNVDIMAVNYGSASIQGIGAHQGSLTSPAGNTFSGSTNNIIDYTTSGSISYYYDAANTATERPSGVSASVWRDAISVHKNCPETISDAPSAGGKPAPTSIDRDILTRHETSFLLFKAMLNDSLRLYNSLIDNGNTNGLIAQIMQVPDYGSINRTLESISPYLSTAVLIQLANKWGADAGLRPSLLNLYISNPEALRNTNLLDTLTSAGWSDGDISALIDASNGQTRRTALESAIDNARTAMDDEGNIIMMGLKSPVNPGVSVNDTTGAGICTDTASIYYGTDSNAVYVYLDSVDKWLQNINDLWTIYARVGYNNFRGSYQTADGIMALPASMSLATEDQETYATYSNLWARVLSAEQTGRTALTLNGQEIQLIDTFSMPDLLYNTGRQLVWNITTSMIPNIFPFPGAHGTSVICHVSVLQMSKPGRNVSDGSISGTYAPGLGELEDLKRFAAYPNPTSGVVAFAYNIPDAGGDIAIVITNVLGEKIAERKCKGSLGKTFWDPAGLPSGMYLYTATYGKGVISKGKIAVVR